MAENDEDTAVMLHVCCAWCGKVNEVIMDRKDLVASRDLERNPEVEMEVRKVLYQQGR